MVSALFIVIIFISRVFTIIITIIDLNQKKKVFYKFTTPIIILVILGTSNIQNKIIVAIKFFFIFFLLPRESRGGTTWRACIGGRGSYVIPEFY